MGWKAATGWKDLGEGHRFTILDALRHSTYAKLQEGKHIHVMVTSPFFAVLDLALPIAIFYAHHAVCCHVPGHYVTNGPAPRMEWLRHNQSQGRLMIIAGLMARGPMGRRCMWLCVFRSAALRQFMTRPGCDETVGLHMAASNSGKAS